MTVAEGQLIGSAWRDGRGNKLQSLDPATGDVVWKGHAASERDVNDAVQAAREAQREWAAASFENRKKILERFSEAVSDHSDDLAQLISREVGKPLWEAKTEVQSVSGKLKPTVAAAEQRNAEIRKPFGKSPGVESVTRFVPHGVVAVFGPFNFPAHLPNGHIMPALLAGNSVIFKPSEHAPAVASFVANLWRAAGLPEGVLNLVHGERSVAEFLLAAEDVNAYCFTGSKAAGLAIQRHFSDRTDKLIALEMGGNNPLVVWDYEDEAAAVFVALQSAFITSGQRCSGARRLIVPASSEGDKFIESLASAAAAIRVGAWSEDPEPYMGPLITEHAADEILAAQRELLQSGATTIVPVEQLPHGRTFLRPGILDVTGIRKREDREIFGPLLQVIRVESFDDAVAEANATEYGLSAGLVARDYARYERFARDVKAGIFTWNQQLTGASSDAPFGGVKSSGNFRPSGSLASDYCVYATASLESPTATAPDKLPPGLSLNI